MIGATKNENPTRRGPRTAAAALVLVAGGLVGAAAVDANRSRLLIKSAAERQELRETLRRFDLRLGNEDQRAVRALDARLNALPPEERDELLGVMRRYHNWLQLLPEKSRDELASLPPSERLPKVQEFAKRYPPSEWDSRSSLDFIQIGGTGPFEFASLCKVWLGLSAAARRQVDALPVGDRKAELVRRGREMKVPRELKPEGFDEAHWAAEAETRIKDMRGPAAGPKDWVARIEAKFEQAGSKDADAAPRARPFLRRLASNLYVQEYVEEHPVDPAKLLQLFESLPPWMRSTFGSFPSDEVRRRLTVLYRSLFPYPEEFRPLPAAPKPTPAPAARPGVPATGTPPSTSAPF